MPVLTKHTFSIELTFTNVIWPFDFADNKMVNFTEMGDPVTPVFARTKINFQLVQVQGKRRKSTGGNKIGNMNTVKQGSFQ